VIRTLIVDDEPLVRSGLRTLLGEDDEVQVIGECGDGRHARRVILEEAPDLVFLDIEMPEADGFEVVRGLPADRRPAIILVTAHDRYAVAAFEYDVVDYLLKPFGDARVWSALEKARLRAREAVASDTGRPLRRLAYRDGERVGLIAVDDIDWIEAVGDYVRIHAGPTQPLVRARLQELAARLDGARFVRIHKSHVVNLDRIRELRPISHGDYLAVLEDGTPLRVSRRYRPALASRTGNYF
jgi:two-component system LytT family response regulator